MDRLKERFKESAKCCNYYIIMKKIMWLLYHILYYYLFYILLSATQSLVLILHYYYYYYHFVTSFIIISYCFNGRFLSRHRCCRCHHSVNKSMYVYIILHNHDDDYYYMHITAHKLSFCVWVCSATHKTTALISGRT